MKKPNVDLILVTAKMAAEWLTLNTHNRPLKNHIVEELERALRADEWKPTLGLPVMLSSESPPVLMNAQHRLWAIVNTGIAAYLLVQKGVDPAVMRYVDLPFNQRTLGDNLGLQGVKQSTKKVEVARSIFKILTGKNKGTPDQIVDTIARFQRGIDWTISASGQHAAAFKAARIRGPFALAHAVSPALVEEIAERAQTGVGCTEGDPANAIRTVCLSVQGNKKGTCDSRHVGEKILYCLMKAIEGRPVSLAKAGAGPIEFFREKLEISRKAAPKVRRAA